MQISYKGKNRQVTIKQRDELKSAKKTHHLKNRCIECGEIYYGKNVIITFPAPKGYVDKKGRKRKRIAHRGLSVCDKCLEPIRSNPGVKIVGR